jgi:CRISPR/Cas system-associated exonuclease Cas4 (RecB family)
MKKNSLKNIHRLINLSASTSPANESFVVDLKSTIERVDQENSKNRKASTGYNPSGIQCIRSMYYKTTGAVKSDDRATAELIGMGEVGSARHLKIQEAICEMARFGIDCDFVKPSKYIKSRGLDYLQILNELDYETLIYYPYLNLKFLTDGIIKYAGQYYILEIKTETMYKWQNRTSVEPSHIEQAICYSIAYNINQVMFLYESRDTLGKKAYIVEVTDEMKEEIISRIETCDSYVKQLKVPPKPKNITKKMCAYCAYKKVCEKDGD